MDFKIFNKPNLELPESTIDDFTTPLILFSNKCDYAEGVQQNMLDVASNFNRLKTFKQPINGVTYYSDNVLKLCTDDANNVWQYIVKTEQPQNNSILICDGVNNKWLNGDANNAQVLLSNANNVPYYNKITIASIQDYNSEFCVLYSDYNSVQWMPLAKLIGARLTIDSYDYSKYINQFSVLCYLNDSYVWQNLDNLYAVQNYVMALTYTPIVGRKTFSHNTELYGDVIIYNEPPPAPLNMIGERSPNKMVLNAPLVINYTDGTDVVHTLGSINDVLVSRGGDLTASKYKAPIWDGIMNYITAAAVAANISDNKTLVFDNNGGTRPKLLWDDLPWDKRQNGLSLTDLPKGKDGQILTSDKKVVKWVDREKTSTAIVLGGYTTTNRNIAKLPAIIRKLFDIIQPEHTCMDIQEFLIPTVSARRTSTEYAAMIAKLKLSKDFATYWTTIIEPSDTAGKYYEHLVKIDSYYSPGSPVTEPTTLS